MRAMDESLRQIANNAGSEGSVVIAKVKTASAASLMLTTVAMIAEKPKEKKGMHPGAQGMGGEMDERYKGQSAV